MQPRLALLAASLLTLGSSHPTPTPNTARDVGSTYAAIEPYSIKVLSSSGATGLYVTEDNEALLGAWMTQLDKQYSNTTDIADVTASVALDGGAQLYAQLDAVDGVTLNDVPHNDWTWLRANLRDANDGGEGRPERVTYMVQKEERDVATFAV